MSKKKAQPELKIVADTKILLEIERPAGPGGTRNILSLGSYVEEVISDSYLLIKMPIYRGYYYMPPRNKPILAYFFMHSRMFSLTVQFLERIERDELDYVKVRVLSGLQPNQRRDCFRLQQCALPVTVERVTKNKNEPPPPAECEIINFSDGGMLFATNENIEVGETVTLSFDIGTVETVEGEVLRLENPHEGIYRQHVAVKFLHKFKEQKDRFYKFIVVQQRERLRQQAEAGAPLQRL